MEKCMKKAFTVSIPENVKKELDTYAKTQGLTRSDVVKESLREYLFVQKFRNIRKKALPLAQKKGFHTDEDVFKEIS